MRDAANIKTLWGDQYDITHTLKKKGDRSSDLIASKQERDRLPPTHCKPEKCPPSKVSELNFKKAETYQKWRDDV